MRPEDRYDSLIVYYASRYGRDPRQVKRQIRVESDFRPDARSPVGATGLLQFMPPTWAEWRDGTVGLQPPPPEVIYLDARDPEDAILASCAYMAWLERELGTLPKALAAYNWGIGHVRRAVTEHGIEWSAHCPIETLRYLLRCLAFTDEVLMGETGGGRS